MATPLTEIQLSVLRVKFTDFLQRVVEIRDAIEGQIYRGFAYTAEQRNIKATYEIAKGNLEREIRALRAALEVGGTEQGPLTAAQLQPMIGLVVNDLTQMNDLVQKWNNASPGGMISNVFFTSFKAGMDTLTAMLKSLVGAAKFGFGVLPWVIVGAITIPFFINIYLKSRKGGFEAGLRETERQITAGRERTMRAWSESAANRREAARQNREIAIKALKFV